MSGWRSELDSTIVGFCEVVTVTAAYRLLCCTGDYNSTANIACSGFTYYLTTSFNKPNGESYFDGKFAPRLLWVVS